MIKIAIFNQKGGTGKTTSVVNIGSMVAEITKKKVLIVDCDSQSNTTNYLRQRDSDKTFIDYIHSEDKIKDIIKSVEYEKKSILNRKIKKQNIVLDIIPISYQIDQIELEHFNYFKNALLEIESEYEYCFFDCPPHLSPLTINALTASNYIIVPALADVDSLGGYELLLDTVKTIQKSQSNIGLEVLGVFLNKVKENQALDKYIIQTCRDGLGNIVFNAYIRDSSLISQARIEEKPINIYKTKSKPYEDYKILTKEIIKRIKEKKGER